MSLKKNAGAIYKQIIDFFEYEIASGRLELGERIQSIRELAVEFKVNPNTIQKALSELERKELIYTDRTNGKFITSDSEKVEELRMILGKTVITDFIENCQLLGISQEEALKIMKNYWRKENE